MDALKKSDKNVEYAHAQRETIILDLCLKCNTVLAANPQRISIDMYFCRRFEHTDETSSYLILVLYH